MIGLSSALKIGDFKNDVSSSDSIMSSGSMMSEWWREKKQLCCLEWWRKAQNPQNSLCPDRDLCSTLLNIRQKNYPLTQLDQSWEVV